jgi:hypothetical protein
MATSRATSIQSSATKPDCVFWLCLTAPAIADPGGKLAKDVEMNPGETVQFSSKEGNVKVVCTEGWPFEEPEHEISDSEILTLKSGPLAKFECYIKPWGAPTFLGPYSGTEVRPR